MRTPLYFFPRRWRWDFSPAIKVIKIIRKYKITMIHSWGLTSSFYGTIAAKICGIKIINGSIRGSTKNGKIDHQYIVRKILLHFADIIISNSKSGLQDFGLTTQNNKKIIYNGFDLSRCEIDETPESIKKELGLSQFNKIVSMIAGIKSTKDFYTYIKAAKHILYSYDNICFLVVGDGYPDYKNKLQKLVADLGLTNNVRFLGFRRDVEKILRVTDIFVHCDFKFTREGIPNSILEAMAMKVPVIATNNGGVGELVNKGENGFIIPPESVELLIEKIEYIIKNPLVAAKISEAGKRTVETKFSLKKIINSYQSIYEEHCI